MALGILINVPFAIIAVVAGLFYYQSLSYQKKSLTRGIFLLQFYQLQA